MQEPALGVDFWNGILAQVEQGPRPHWQLCEFLMQSLYLLQGQITEREWEALLIALGGCLCEWLERYDPRFLR